MVDIDPTRTATSYVATDLAPGSEYWWNVTAYAVAGLLTPPSTTPSNVLAVGQPLAAQLSSPSNTSTSVQLNWTNSARYGGGLSFGSYAIEVVQGHSTTLYANVTSRATLGADVTGLTSGASYSFYVETFDRVGGCGGATPTYTVTPSNTVTAGTPAPLYVTVASARPSVDVGQADAFACTPSGGLPPYTFGWNFTNGSSVFVSEPSATSHAYATPAPSGVTVTCEVKDHASSTLTAATTVFVDPAPRVLATVSPLNVSVGSAVGFQCTASEGTPPLTVGWALGNGGRISSSGGRAPTARRATPTAGRTSPSAW